MFVVRSQGGAVSALDELEILLSRATPGFEAFNASNGWGKYENLVRFVRDYLSACEKNPTAVVSVSR